MSDQTLDRWHELGRHFDHNGQHIFYRAGGARAESYVRSGDSVLLCIHGFPTASWDWHALWPKLTARFALVLAPDMVGFGFSAKPRRYAYSIFDQADLHEALLRKYGVHHVHLLAHDYGDTVAQELLARDLERRGAGDHRLIIESACLLNGGLFPETHRARLVQKLLASRIGFLFAALMNERSFNRSFSSVFGPNTRPSAAELADFWALVSRSNGTAVMHRLVGYMAERRAHRERWVGALQNTEVPVRLINGPDDPVSGAHMVARYRELVANPDIVSLPGIGHYPQVEDVAGTWREFAAFHDPPAV